MRYLITGGAGFIGSHLSDFLIQKGNQVDIIDDLSTGNFKNIEHLKQNPNFAYHLESLSHTALVKELVDQCDVIFHLAAAVGVRLIVESPVRTIETNLSSTERILRIASLKKKKIIFTSTSEVYGKSKDMPYKETQDLVIGQPLIGRWSYACSKAIDEFLMIAYWKEKKVPIVIARLFNTTGPRQIGHYGMVIPRFVQQALKNEPLTVYGDGSQTRTFCHVHDTIRALDALSQKSQCIGEIYNVGNSQAISIRDLAQRVIQKSNSNSKIEFIPYEVAFEKGFEDMQDRLPDTQKIQQQIGFKTEKNLDHILEDVINYYQN